MEEATDHRQCTIASHASLCLCVHPKMDGPTVDWQDVALPHAKCSICGVCYDCSAMIAAGIRVWPSDPMKRALDKPIYPMQPASARPSTKPETSESEVRKRKKTRKAPCFNCCVEQRRKRKKAFRVKKIVRQRVAREKRRTDRRTNASAGVREREAGARTGE